MPGTVTGAQGARTVVVAEDSVMLREGLITILRDRGYRPLAPCGDAEELLDAVARHQPALVVTDIRMPPSHSDEGVRAAETIKERWPTTAVMLLSQYVEPRYAVKLMHMGGGIGYLLKDRVGHLDDFFAALERVLDGGSAVDPEVVATLLKRPRVDRALDALTTRELEILGLMAEGHSNSAICGQLFLSPKTLETHISAIFAKLGLLPAADDHRRVKAVLSYLRSTP